LGTTALVSTGGYTHGWRNLFQSGGGHKCTSKTVENLRFKLAYVTSQALKCDVTAYAPYEGLNQCFSKWTEQPPWGRFWGVRGRKAKVVIGGQKRSTTTSDWSLN